MLNKKKLIFIMLLSFLVQGIFLTLYPLHSPKGDAANYDAIGFNLATGKGFSLDGVNPITLYPLYPIFLSLLYTIFGHNYLIVQLFLALFITITCGIVYLLGKVVFNERVGFVTAIFISVYPPFFSLSRIMYAEALFLLFLYTSILMLFLFIEMNKASILFFSGILLGIAILTKPHVIYFPLVISLFFFWFFSLRRALIFILIFNSAVLLSFTPWAVRNYIIFKDFRPVSSFAIRDGKFKIVDLAAGYRKEEAILAQESHQQRILKDFYVKAKMQPDLDYKKSFLRKIVNYFGSDYTGNPRNFFDLVRRMYITSYGDILDIGVPFKAFAQDEHLSIHYWKILVVKIILIFFSFLIFLFGIIHIFWVFLKQNRGSILLALFLIVYTLFFYAYVIFMGQVGICGRYGIPVLPILILFAVDQFFQFSDKINHLIAGKREKIKK